MRLHRIPARLIDTLFRANQGEPFEKTKERLQARLGVPEKDFAKYKFALVHTTTWKTPSALADSELKSFVSILLTTLTRTLRVADIIFDHEWKGSDSLGLDHIDKGPRKPNTGERAIVIR